MRELDTALLAVVTGGGPSLGDRGDWQTPENPNAWGGMMDKQTTVPHGGYWGGTDAGMERMPANPNMDMGMSREPFSSSPGGSSAGGLDI